ncbi:MAG: hypothetical protein ABI406_04905 [Ktedonobacteraceae bacterium]
MQDSESNYPLHQPRKNGHRRPPDDDFSPGQNSGTDDQFEDEEEPAPRPRRSRRGVVHQREQISTPTLPPGRLKNSLLAGVIAGVLCIGQSIIITLANASTYRAYEAAKDTTVKSSLALTIFGIGILTFFISMLICLVTGFIVGRMAVERRLAFLAGFVAGVIVYAISFFINFIPNYPGSNTGSGGGAGAATGGIFLAIVFVILWGVIGGLVSLLGGWLATRRHSYYVG